MTVANPLFLLVVSYSMIFVPALVISRIALLALGRYRAHWFAIVLAHALTLLAVFALEPWLMPALLSTRKFATFVSLTNGAAVDTQVLLMAGDLIRPWLAASAREHRQWFFARHPFATGTALTAASFVIGIALANWSSRTIDLTEEWLHYQIGAALDRDHNTRQLAAALRQTFPNELETLVNSYTHALRPLLSKRSQFDDRFSRLPSQFTRDVSAFVKSRRADVARATDRQLAAVAQAEPAMLEQFQPRPLLCAAFAVGQTDTARLDPTWNQPAPDKEGETTVRFVAANLLAAREGMNHPVHRDVNNVRRETALAFRARLVAMETPSIVALASDPQALNVARAEDQCRVALAIARAVAGLPQRQAAELWAYQISHRP